jgi:hypothetical protein
MESLLALVNIDPALLAKIGPIVLLVMGCLSGVAVILNAFANFFNKKASLGKVAAVMAKINEYLQKINDFLSGNVKH